MKDYKYCQCAEFEEVTSAITGNLILVNLSPDRILVNPNLDLNAVSSIAMELNDFWEKEEAEKGNSWKQSQEMKIAYQSFSAVKSLDDFMDSIESVMSAVVTGKEPRGQLFRALYLLTRFWRSCIVGVTPNWTQQYKINCPIIDFTIDHHQSWLSDISSMFSVKTEGEKQRSMGLALRIASTSIGIKELGDVTPSTCSQFVYETLGTRGPGITKALFTCQVKQYDTKVKYSLSEWGGAKFRVRKKSDVTFAWATEEDPTVENWRQFITEWLKERPSKGPALKCGEFFLNYLVANKSVTRNPEEFCRRSYSASTSFKEWTDEKMKNRRALFDANNITSEFIDWILDSRLSTPDDFDRPVRSPNHWNPVSRLQRKQQAIQTHREAIPTRYINEMIKIITENDFAWPKSHKNDYITWFNKETQAWEKVWSPVRSSALLLKLYLPLRTFQVRVLDSGEMDTEVYKDGQWTRNDGPLAVKGRKVIRKGFLRRYSDKLSGRTHTGFFINTNKTQDRGVDEEDKGYEIPWQHEQAIDIAEKLVSWQKTYNPIDSPISWADLHDGTIVRSGRNEQLGTRSETCFLFRDPCGTYRNEPLTDSRLRPYWIALLDELEKRFNARGETLPDGSPILFIEKRVDRPGRPGKGDMMRPVYDLHTLRVSLITALATEGGVPIQILSKCIAGHASILMTLYYVKLGVPYITEKLAEAQKKIGVDEQKNFFKFLQSAEYRELESVVASNDSTGLIAIQENNPGSWIIDDKGICPVGGSMCQKGGGKLTSNPQLSDYSPAPGGARNCVRCRFMITGPAFIGGLVAHFNAIGVKLIDISERFRGKEKHIRALENEMSQCEASGEMFTRLAELNAAYARQERDMSELDETSHNWHATYRLIERCKGILAQDKDKAPDGRLSLVLAGGMSDLETAIEMTTDFDLMNAVCQVANVYPGEDVVIANLRRSRILDSMFKRNDRNPVFATLSEDEALAVGNEFVALLMAKIGKSDTVALMEGRQMLASTGLEKEADAFITKRIGIPIRVEPMPNQDAIKSMAYTLIKDAKDTENDTDR